MATNFHGSTADGPSASLSRPPEASYVEVQEYSPANVFVSSADSAYDSEVASYTSSLVSLVTNYTFENGRRYHSYKAGAYIFPNDELESERLDLVHQMLKVSMGGNPCYSPLISPRRILDIGTGTGIWAMEIGDKFPQADVVGNDLSPIQPKWVPPNVHFEIDDVEAQWMYSSKFDFIHCRTMGSCIRDWPGLVKQCFDNLHPGGWAEFIEVDMTFISPDNSLVKGSDVERLNTLFIETTRESNMEPCPGPLLHDWLDDAGFADVTTDRQFLPLGTWPANKTLKEVGAWNYVMVTESLEGLLNYLFAKFLGMGKEEIAVACTKIRQQLKDPAVHCMYTLYITRGMKPAEDDPSSDW